MGYYIYAWLENGEPQLQIIDADSRSVCVSWRYKEKAMGSLSDKKEIQRLFRDLMLLTCRQETKNCRVFQTKAPQYQPSTSNEGKLAYA